MGLAAPKLTIVADNTSATTLVWDDITVGGWKDLLGKAPRSNLLQSWAYAKTNMLLYRMWPKFGVFYRNGKPVAMAMVSIRRAFGFEAVRLHRAPVWLVKNPSPELVGEVLALLRKTFPPKWSRRVSFLPELPDTPKTEELLTKAGFTKRDSHVYKSSWVDLTPPLADLQKSFSRSFKNNLKKSQGFDFRIVADPTPVAVYDMLLGYAKDRARRKYRGPSVKFIKALYKNCKPSEWLLLEAWHEDELMAAQLFVVHGKAATYQIGWTTERGRNARAHHAMLFAAVKRLKEMGIEGLDLGGLTEKDGGLNSFKADMRGEVYTLTGGWK